MSWEHTKRKAKCNKCGHEGVYIESSDDWNRHKQSWEGFSALPIGKLSTMRMKVGNNDGSPACPECGCNEIIIGEVITS